jgi:rhamnose transport system permease protein
MIVGALRLVAMVLPRWLRVLRRPSAAVLKPA